MDSLPFEVLSRIIYFLKGPYGNDKLSPYAGISIWWQSAIESHTFRATRVKLPDKSLDQLRKILLTNGTRRVQFVRTLSVYFDDSPSESSNQQNEVISIDEEWWRAAITQLFVIIRDILQRVEHPPIIELSFGGRRPQFIDDWGSVSPDVPITIPHLDRLTKMGMDLNYWETQIADADIIALTDSLPNLRELRIGFWDDFEWGRRRRIKHRKGTSGKPS
jgi:hypothetical protein